MPQSCLQMVKVTSTPLQLLVMWKTFFFRKSPLCRCTVVASESDFLFESQHRGPTLNYESAVVFTKRVNEPNVLTGANVHVFALHKKKSIGFITIRERYFYLTYLVFTRRWHEKNVAPRFLPPSVPPSLFLCFSLVYVSGWCVALCSSHTAAPASIIGFPPTVNPLMGHHHDLRTSPFVTAIFSLTLSPTKLPSISPFPFFKSPFFDHSFPLPSHLFFSVRLTKKGF